MQALAIATTQTPSPQSPRRAHNALYRDEYPAMLVDYFESRPLGLRMIDAPGQADCARAVCSEIPTFQGFSKLIGVSPATMNAWDRNPGAPEWLESRARAKAIQEDWMANALASGIANPTGAIFVAKNMLGWRDKTEVETVTRTEDSEATTAMKRALEHATPEQLAALSTLVQAMLANAPATTLEAGTLESDPARA